MLQAVRAAPGSDPKGYSSFDQNRLTIAGRERARQHLFCQCSAVDVSVVGVLPFWLLFSVVRIDGVIQKLARKENADADRGRQEHHS